jgi:hypothetical protein
MRAQDQAFSIHIHSLERKVEILEKAFLALVASLQDVEGALSEIADEVEKDYWEDFYDD